VGAATVGVAAAVTFFFVAAIELFRTAGVAVGVAGTSFVALDDPASALDLTATGAPTLAVAVVDGCAARTMMSAADAPGTVTAADMITGGRTRCSFGRFMLMYSFRKGLGLLPNEVTSWIWCRGRLRRALSCPGNQAQRGTRDLWRARQEPAPTDTI
jgi:hypothetical protein